MPARTRRILRLRIALVGSEPEIWRTVDVDETLTLAQLHVVLQIAFGWQNTHLHQFTEEDPGLVPTGIPRIGRRPRTWMDQWSLLESGEPGDEDEADTTIAAAMQFDGPLWYEYDFGDCWMHRIDLIERAPAHSGEPRVTLVRGERRGPFEDSGGIRGYEDMLDVLADVHHPDHDRVSEWVRATAGPWASFDPADAGLDAARAELTLLAEGRDPAGDMSGLIDPSRGIDAASPIVRLAEELPVPLRVDLRRHLSGANLLDPVEIDDPAALIRPFAWLLARVGDGMPLTSAGWMPPATVRAAMVELGWSGALWGQANREQNAIPVRVLRESAEALRLVRKLKGALVAPAKVRAIAQDAGALADQIAHMLLRQRMSEHHRLASTLLVLALADGSVSTDAEGEEHVLAVLYDLGWVTEDGAPLDSRWYRDLTAPVRDTLRAFGFWGVWLEDEPRPAIEDVRRFARRALR